MKPIDAPGNRALQDALKNEHVYKIVDILINIHDVDKNFFKDIVRFLRHYPDKSTSADFAERLDGLRKYEFKRVEAGGHLVPPASFSPEELCQAIETIYEAEKQGTVDYRRGAIVELLAYKLISSRCQEGECKSNCAFHHPPDAYTSKQVDVAVFSEEKQQIEGYSCKMKILTIARDDLLNLLDLSDEAKALGYDVHLGAISFDERAAVERKLRSLSQSDLFLGVITPYGLDNLFDLLLDPFS